MQYVIGLYVCFLITYFVYKLQQPVEPPQPGDPQIPPDSGCGMEEAYMWHLWEDH